MIKCPEVNCSYRAKSRGGLSMQTRMKHDKQLADYLKETHASAPPAADLDKIPGEKLSGETSIEIPLVNHNTDHLLVEFAENLMINMNIPLEIRLYYVNWIMEIRRVEME